MVRFLRRHPYVQINVVTGGDMKNIVRVVSVAVLFVSLSLSQVKFRLDKTETQDKGEYTGPPDIYSQLSFKDENNNGILENRETAVVTVKLMNKGKGRAENIVVSVAEDSPTPDKSIYIEKSKVIDRLLPKQEKVLTFKIVAGKNIKSGVRKFTITGREKEGYDMEPSELLLSMEEFSPPKLQFIGLEILETGDSRIYYKGGVPDGQLQAGEQVKVRLVVQNVGATIAENVKYSIASNDENIKLLDKSGELGNVKSGEVKEVAFIISPNNRVTTADNLPVYLTLEDTPKDGVLKNFGLPIKLNQKPPEAKVLAVEARPSELREVTQIKFTGTKSSALVVDDFVDIFDVQPSKTVYKNAVAIIIGVENYRTVARAPYAANDADVIKKYFENRLGINGDRIFLYKNDDVNGIFFKKMFDPDKGRLKAYVKENETDVFIFYSGHGMPNKSADQTFLFPVDGDKEFIEDTGYPMVKFYDDLNKLNAKSVTVILDACFSGSSRSSQQIKEENLIAAKGIRLKVTKPWTAYKNFTVINSSSGEETSLGFDQTQTGLFTYYLSAGLKGEADKDKNGEITLGELKEYVVKNVVTVSRRISGTQTPEFYGDPNRVLVKY